MSFQSGIQFRDQKSSEAENWIQKVQKSGVHPEFQMIPNQLHYGTQPVLSFLTLSDPICISSYSILFVSSMYFQLLWPISAHFLCPMAGCIRVGSICCTFLILPSRCNPHLVSPAWWNLSLPNSSSVMRFTTHVASILFTLALLLPFCHHRVCLLHVILLAFVLSFCVFMILYVSFSRVMTCAFLFDISGFVFLAFLASASLSYHGSCLVCWVKVVTC